MLRHSCWTGHIPRPIWILALILVLTGASFALTLKETAEVTGDQIYMKDIIEEADDQPWAEISVLAAPAKGSKRPVYKTFVVTVLRHNGFLEEAQSLDGPNKVDVLRLAEPKTEEAVIREVDHSWIWDEVKEEISAYISRLVPEGLRCPYFGKLPQIAEGRSGSQRGLWGFQEHLRPWSCRCTLCLKAVPPGASSSLWTLLLREGPGCKDGAQTQRSAG